MYFSLQKSGELLQGEEAPASGLYFDCAKLPADWYAQLQADLGTGTAQKTEALKAPASEVKAPAKAKSEVKTPSV